MKNEELVLVNPKEFGLEDGQANEIIGNLPELIEDRKLIDTEYQEVMEMDDEDPEKEKIAREVRIKYQKHRTQGIGKWHKIKKDVFLRGGQFVDALNRDQVTINQDKESKLMEIEKRAEILEKKRLEELQAKRVELLSQYVEDAEERDLASMQEDVWEPYLASKKKEYEDRLESEKKAEEERIEQERKVKLYNERKEQLIPFWSHLKEDHKSADLGELTEEDFNIILNEAKKATIKHEKEQEKIRAENERLRKEREAAEAKAKKEREEAEAREKARIEAEKEKERIANEKAEAERKAYEERIAKQKAEAEKLLQEKLEREEAELKAKKEAEEAEKKAKMAPDKDKLNNAIEELSLPTPNDLTRSIQTFETLKELQSKLEGYKKWAKTLIEKL